MKTPPQVSRSQGTRDRILEAARQLFAVRGYEGTTLREVAARADANVALVIRYYDSKDQLFASAANIDLHLPKLAEMDPETLGERLVQHFLMVWEDETSGRQLVALLRAAVNHAAAKARMQDIFHRQLLATLLPISATPAQAETRAALIASQMLGLALVRYVLELPMGNNGPEPVTRAMAKTIQRYLVEPL